MNGDPPEAPGPSPGSAAAYSREQVATIRHELRTPVNHIVGYGEMLQEQAADDGLTDLAPGLTSIRAAGEGLLAVINEHIGQTTTVTDAEMALLGERLPPVIEQIMQTADALTTPALAMGRDDIVGDLQRIRSACERLLRMTQDGVLSLPADSASYSTWERQATAEGARHTPGLHGGRLLVAEDNQVSREMLVQRLTREGHGVEAVENGREALELLRQSPFDLVLLDLMMPEMDGFEALRRIKSDPALQHIPVIMLSAVDELDTVVQCIEIGAEDYLPKPFNAVLLRARINASLEKKRLRDQEMLHLQQIEEEKARSDKLLNVILPLGLALSAESEFDRVAERLLDGARLVCNADGGTLYLREGASLRPTIRYDHAPVVVESGGEESSMPVPLQDPDTGEANESDIVAAAALRGTSMSSEHPTNKGGQQSMLCVPLKDHTGEVIGVLQIVNAKDQEGHVVPFEPYLQQVVESLSSQVAVVLNNQLLRKREAELAKFEHDVQIGRQIQADFLPHTMVEVEGWEVAGYCSPAREVSGDFYDVFVLPGGHLGFVVADVCDKGVPAALFMALTRSLLRALAEHGQGPGLPLLLDARKASSDSVRKRLATLMADLSALNAIVLTSNYIADNHAETNMFATLFFGVLAPDTNMLTYVNGGHEAAVVLGASGVKGRLKPTGPAVGILPGAEFDIGQMELEPGDSIYVYSDGITDARNEQGKGFSEQQLLDVLTEGPITSAAELLGRVEARVRAHIGHATQFDDMTQLAVHSLQT